MDGVFHFRLQELKRRWEEIAGYVPIDMGETSLNGFLGFLIEDGVGKIFVKNGRVYDENYHQLSKSALTAKRSIITEIVLSGAEKVYCFGETERTTALFLRKHYKGKAIFC